MLGKIIIPESDESLVGREQPMALTGIHAVNGRVIRPPFVDGLNSVFFGMGCFWGAERLFWQQPGVFSTAVGYGGGTTLNPLYEEVCSGRTGHTELVRVVYDPSLTDLQHLLKVFWESHDPTQGMRQGNDVGTQYRSAIFVEDHESFKAARISAAHYQVKLWQQGWGGVTTEIRQGVVFYYAEEYHQQYLHKNPGGYCGLKGCSVTY